METKQIELAKSWFQLAQICIILSGFFFAIGGIAYSNSLMISNNVMNLFSNYQMQYGDEKLPQDTISFFEFFMGY